MFFTLEVVCTALREGIQIDRLLFAESPEEQAIWQVNRPLPVYLTNGDKRPGFCFRYHGSRYKAAGPQVLKAGGYPIFGCGRATCCD